MNYVNCLFIILSVNKLNYRRGPYLRGPGGSMTLGGVGVGFAVVPDGGECQLPGAFCRVGKCCSWPGLSGLEVLNMWVVAVRAWALNAISGGWTFLGFVNLSSPAGFWVDP